MIEVYPFTTALIEHIHAQCQNAIFYDDKCADSLESRTNKQKKKVFLEFSYLKM